MSNVKVICRFRPPNSREKEENATIIVDFPSDVSVVYDSNDQKQTFNFDKVFPMSTKQHEIYDECHETVEDLFSGYNGTIFVYGQTGAGKSFTMSGVQNDIHLKGLIPRLIERVFDKILESSEDMEFTVGCSFLEIYCEKIKDLLDPVNDNLAIHEEKSRGVYVKNLSNIYCGSTAEVYSVLDRGNENRATSATKMNAESSRSHSIFVITVTCKTSDGSLKSGNLYLVDLAGSEKVGKTGASGQTLEEAKKINKSLSALGMVINALTDGKSTHVPYRDSKLTRILQESLGGNSRTTLIINCSPCQFNDQETLGTLRFGTRAKSIQNKAVVNQELSSKELKKLYRRAEMQSITYYQWLIKCADELESWHNSDPVETPINVLEIRQLAKPRELEKAPSATTATNSTNNNSNLAPIDTASVVSSSNADIPIEIPTDITPSESDVYLRENELMDELTEKETILKQTSDQLNHYQSKVSDLMAENQDLNQFNESLKLKLNEMEFKLEEFKAEMEQTVELKSLRSEKSYVALDKAQQQENEVIALAMDALDELQEGNMDVLKNKVMRLGEQNQLLAHQNHELHRQLKTLTEEYEMVLEQSIENEEDEDAKPVFGLSEKLKKLHSEKSKTVEMKLKDLQDLMEQKDAEINRLEMQLNSQDIKVMDDSPDGLKRQLSKQITDFETMKKQLMRDVQSKCDKIKTLQSELDDAKDSYGKLINSNPSGLDIKKMAMLERNLDQLTKVQQQLVSQNNQLKKETALNERKLGMKEERISKLQEMHEELSHKLLQQSQQYEQQLADLRMNSGGAESVHHARIAKPIRGGQQITSPDEAMSKRSSWFMSSMWKK
eukprot:NODE_163_length_16507_cov_1.031814.p1 type:complete len:839 gc:universal NODE_163_length_16507_cov_1.031814:902-3418(+)